MIRLEPLASHARLARVYDGDPVDPMAPYVATFVIEWAPDDARALWVKGFSGRLTRRTLRELLTMLVDLGVHTVLARRADGHVLPLGQVGEDGITRISVAQLQERFARPGASDWVEL